MDLPAGELSRYHLDLKAENKPRFKAVLDVLDRIFCLKIEQGKREDSEYIREFQKISHRYRSDNGIDFYESSTHHYNPLQDSNFLLTLDTQQLAQQCDLYLEDGFDASINWPFLAKFQEMQADPANAYKPIEAALHDSERKHLVILDIDNTLRNDVLIDSKNIYPDIEQEFKEKLEELNRSGTHKIALLTGRDNEEIIRSNLEHTSLPTWASYGFQSMGADGEFVDELQPQQEDLDLKDRLQEHLQGLGVGQYSYRIVAHDGKVYIFISEPRLNEIRNKIIGSLDSLELPNGWHFVDNKNRYITFKTDDTMKKNSDKGIGIEKILQYYGVNRENAKDYNIYVFGDSEPDLKAMKKVQEELGDSGANIYNCAVGWCIPKQEDFKLYRLAGHESVRKLFMSL